MTNPSDYYVNIEYNLAKKGHTAEVKCVELYEVNHVHKGALTTWMGRWFTGYTLHKVAQWKDGKIKRRGFSKDTYGAHPSSETHWDYEANPIKEHLAHYLKIRHTVATLRDHTYDGPTPHRLECMRTGAWLTRYDSLSEYYKTLLPLSD